MTQQMAPYVDEFIENRMGGFFWCEKSKNPNAKRVMIAAHMDEIGFMITNITKKWNDSIHKFRVVLQMIFGKDNA